MWYLTVLGSFNSLNHSDHLACSQRVRAKLETFLAELDCEGLIQATITDTQGVSEVKAKEASYASR